MICTKHFGIFKQPLCLLQPTLTSCFNWTHNELWKSGITDIQYCFPVMTQSLFKRTHHFQSNGDPPQFFLPLADFVFAFGIFAWFMLDLYFIVSHSVVIGLISLQSLFSGGPVVLSNSWWHWHPNCEGKLRLKALLFSHFTFFIRLRCQQRSIYELWDVFLLLIAM